MGNLKYSAALQFKNGKESGGNFVLNPFAREWDPVRDRAPEEDRGIFLTFTQGLPVNDNEIHQFFNQ